MEVFPVFLFLNKFEGRDFFGSAIFITRIITNFLHWICVRIVQKLSEGKFWKKIDK